MLYNLKSNVARVLAVVVSVIIMTGSVAVADDSTTVRSYLTDTTESKITISDLAAYDSEGNAREIGDGKDFETSIAAILDGLKDGEMGATKDAYFEDVEDAADGIIKTVFDIAAKPIEAQIDVVLVLDVSGSMNMWTDSASNSHQTVPDLNPDNYYKIAAGKFINDTDEDVYFKFFDYFDTAKNWTQITQDEWAALCTALGFSITTVTSTMITSWVPQDNLYYLVGTEYVNAPVELNASYEFGSPADDNPSGSFDRMMLEKWAAASLAEEVFAASSLNRVGVVNFAGVLYGSLDLTTDSDAVSTFLSTRRGYGSTSYSAGLNQAYNFLISRSNTSIPSYVIFVSDGIPTDGTSGITSANNIKNNTNAEIYSVGIQAGETASAVLSQIATSADHFKDCATVDEFNELLEDITADLTGSPDAELFDVITVEYDLICDTDHPFTIGDASYTSLSDIPDDVIVISDDLKSIQWAGGSVSSDGIRISYYTQMTEDAQFGEAGSETYNTNESASLQYRKTTLVDGKVQVSDEVTTITLNSPSVQVDTSILTSALTSDKMTDDDPSLVGESLVYEDYITYYQTVTNTGVLDLTDIQLYIEVPDGTEYASGGLPSNDASYVTFTVSSLSAGESSAQQFKAKVVTTATEGTIECTGLFGITGATDSIADGVPQLETNTLVNPLADTVVETEDDADDDTVVVPQTGDASNPLLWLLLATIASVGMMVYVLVNQKKKIRKAS